MMVDVDYSTDSKKGMDCIARACKDNKDGRCQRFRDADEFLDALRRGGGCAISWMYSGRLPKVLSIDV